MEIKQVTVSNFYPNLLQNFNRYQEVTQILKKDGTDWVLEDVSYIRDWDEEKKQRITHYMLRNLEQGGIIFGAFDDSRLIGFIQLDGKLSGSFNEYVNLSFLLISYGYRQKGLGSILFTAASEKAVSLGAKKLYISAHAAVESIAFYLKMGCIDAQEVIWDFIDAQSDRQMEYVLQV